jgi:hypothetical protein
LPSREVLLKHLAGRLGDEQVLNQRTVLHYLDGRVEVDLFLNATADKDSATIKALRQKCNEISAKDPYFGEIQLHLSNAQE